MTRPPILYASATGRSSRSRRSRSVGVGGVPRRGGSSPARSRSSRSATASRETKLSKPINIVAGNGFFEKKKPEYAKSGNYLTRSIVSLNPVGKNSSITRINEKLQAFETWSALDIEQRQDMLIALGKDVWSTTPIDAT